jgi:hypothetical protein
MSDFALTEDERREWIEGPALELAAMPMDQRADAILTLIDEIDVWLQANFPDFTSEDLRKVRLRYSFEIIKSAAEISKGCSGIVGNA